MTLVDYGYYGGTFDSLNLDGCTRLTHLPDGLSVGGALNLDGCTRLTHLPDGLSVGGALYNPLGLSVKPQTNYQKILKHLRK